MKKVGFWVVVALVSVAAQPLYRAIAAGPAGELVPGLRKLAAS